MKQLKISNEADVFNAKAKMLPLQGPNLWHKWAKFNKESFQKTLKKIFKQKNKKREILEKSNYNT